MFIASNASQEICRSEQITRRIWVEATSYFVPERSSLKKNRYFFAYRIRIKNNGDCPVQLRSRHWVITDGLGHTRDVQGPGVVGKQPWIKPGEAYEYTSFCPLPTFFGVMEGSYEMVWKTGGVFHAAVGPFSLMHPAKLN